MWEHYGNTKDHSLSVAGQEGRANPSYCKISCVRKNVSQVGRRRKIGGVKRRAGNTENRGIIKAEMHFWRPLSPTRSRANQISLLRDMSSPALNTSQDGKSHNPSWLLVLYLTTVMVNFFLEFSMFQLVTLEGTTLLAPFVYEYV